MYLSVLSVFILLDTKCPQCLKSPEEGDIPWDWSYSWLELPLWVLGIQSWSFARTASALTAKLSLQPQTCFFRISSFQYKHIMNCIQSWELELGGCRVLSLLVSCETLTQKRSGLGILVQWHTACAAHTTPLFGSPATWRNHHCNKKNQTKHLAALKIVKGRSSVSVNNVVLHKWGWLYWKLCDVSFVFLQWCLNQVWLLWLGVAGSLLLCLHVTAFHLKYGFMCSQLNALAGYLQWDTCTKITEDERNINIQFLSQRSHRARPHGWPTLQFPFLDYTAPESSYIQDFSESIEEEESIMGVVLGRCSSSSLLICLATPVTTQNLPWGLLSMLSVQSKSWHWHWL